MFGDIMLFLIIIIILILLILTIFYKNHKLIEYNQKDEKIYTFNGKLKEYIFTYHEKIFFEQLRRITDDNNCYIFPKMRIADIIDTYDKTNLKKIDCKHIDYTVCNKLGQPILFIELDDPTHEKKYIKERDEKKDIIFKSVGKKIIRVNKYNRDKSLYYINKILKQIQT